ncbi:Myotubularinrelated protein 4like [Caligus rogercresseyi]|uniref:Myotubularinrelated protein 4like n=1 Tax=Caligus rogercresseyi TaxID=217165 RepID=A0A7T8H3A3_CALRO|nr:Myotubularinrelated protein 4like [Caligus rogercresseyi]
MSLATFITSRQSTLRPFLLVGALDGTKWLTHMSGLLKPLAAPSSSTAPTDGTGHHNRVAEPAIAGSLLPHLRGLPFSCEKEWLDFGHKMADRCGLPGGASDPNERSPIFLQWCDCVPTSPPSYLCQTGSTYIQLPLRDLPLNNQQSASGTTWLNGHVPYGHISIRRHSGISFTRARKRRSGHAARNIFAAPRTASFPVESSVGESSTEWIRKRRG